MRHSKREKLLAEDIDNAMKLRNVEVCSYKIFLSLI